MARSSSLATQLDELALEEVLPLAQGAKESARRLETKEDDSSTLELLVQALRRISEAESTIAAQQDRIKQLEEMAMTDPLTGLANRRGFSLMFQRELARQSRPEEARGGVVVACDLNGFKTINDTHGHGVGDICLQAFARILSQSIRRSDIVARIGGDEFVLVFCGFAKNACVKRLKKLQETISHTPINFEGGTLYLSASFGAAAYGPEAMDEEELIAEADRNLYADKPYGR